MHNTRALQPLPIQEHLPSLLAPVQQALGLPCSPEPEQPRRRGHPIMLTWPHLWLSLLLSVLLGMDNYQQGWRRLCSEAIGPFLPVQLTDDALIKRLKQAGIEPLLSLFYAISQQLAQSLQAVSACQLAPFASRIVCIDETTWDAVQRHLKPLRALAAGDGGLLPGKLAARFNIRSQQWELLQWRHNVLANCKVEVLSLLEGLPAFSLILFDLGYFSFPWLDYLTQMQYYFVCRLREKVSYRLVHSYYRHHGTLDALVWVGAHRSQRCGCLMRLVRFYDGKGLRTYLTNVLDPRQLSMKEVAQLYARRWDIELAFLTLKEQLGLQHWWSGHPLLLQQQCLLVLIVAQLLQALRMQIAAQADVDPFDVSLPLLIEYVPYFITTRQSPIDWVLRHGKPLGFIRPSSRYVARVPDIALTQMSFPASAIATTRLARYLTYPPLDQDDPSAGPKVSKTSSAKKRATAKRASHTAPPFDS
jgi:hypothetical protein